MCPCTTTITVFHLLMNYTALLIQCYGIFMRQARSCSNFGPSSALTEPDLFILHPKLLSEGLQVLQPFVG